jgi:hypothetical protein
MRFVRFSEQPLYPHTALTCWFFFVRHKSVGFVVDKEQSNRFLSEYSTSVFPYRTIPSMFHAHSSSMLHTLCNWQRRLVTHIHSTCCFSSAFTKLRKTTISFVMSVRPSDRPQGKTRFPLDGFSWNFISEYFSKICRENLSFIQICKNNGHLTWRPIYIYDHITLSSS